jgi:hypothetical protein
MQFEHELESLDPLSSLVLIAGDGGRSDSYVGPSVFVRKMYLDNSTRRRLEVQPINLVVSSSE